MIRRGFTIVEIIIVITIIGILMGLGTVGLANSQANARDIERKADAETIALHMENYYRTNSGAYPAVGTIKGFESTKLRDIDPKSLMAPSETVVSLAYPNDMAVPTGMTVKQYIYQPVKATGTLCSDIADECRRFNLYYKTEVTMPGCDVSNNICKIESKYQ